jgi:hypothetical protein
MTPLGKLKSNYETNYYPNGLSMFCLLWSAAEPKGIL